MSRAFVKEMDDLLPADPVVQRPQSRPMTRRGLEAFRKRLAAATEEAERRQLEDVVEGAIVVEPPPDRGIVAFGATVKVSGAGPKERTFTIVGEDEIDVESGKIGAESPLAQALIGARAGDRVTWQRPAGPAELSVRSVAYET